LFVLVDDLWPKIGSQLKRPVHTPLCSDSELVTMAILAECCGWVVEAALLANFRQHPDLFSHLPLVKFHLAPASKGDGDEHEADYGYSRQAGILAPESWQWRGDAHIDVVA